MMLSVGGYYANYGHKELNAQLAANEPESGEYIESDSQESAALYTLGEDFKQQQNAKIMLIDDEAITLKVIQHLLEHAGYQNFILLDDSRIALEKLREHKPDMLLLDVVMPEVSGFDILKCLRNDPEFAHLPVIILTSASDPATKLQALDLGATDFLSKPVDASELALRVRNTLAAKAYQDQISYYDVLTHLPNRHLFKDRLDWSVLNTQRDGSDFAMLHITFDDFKKIIDAFGPTIGDEVLKQLAQRLAVNLRPSDIQTNGVSSRSTWLDLYHLSGAEFAVLLSSPDGTAGASAFAQRILQSLSEPFIADQTQVYLKPSIGVAGFPDDASTSTSLVKLAMGASSQASVQGGGRMQFYSSTMNNISVKRLNVEAGLRAALENREFKLLYQPKVEIASNEIVGAEALIRWQSADGNIVSPTDFIPIAEETGLILPIGEWVLREACAQALRWQEEGLKIKVSVNIAASQLFEVGFVDLVREVLSRANLAPDSLMLEITESFLIDRVAIVQETISRLHKIGVGISIDDFGTGYSSLSYLKNFNADELKLDKAFIDDIADSKEDQALVFAVTYLARELGMSVCAEGVETVEQLDYLRKIDCTVVQGFYFDRPLEAEVFMGRIGNPIC